MTLTCCVAFIKLKKSTWEQVNEDTQDFLKYRVIAECTLIFFTNLHKLFRYDLTNNSLNRTNIDTVEWTDSKVWTKQRTTFYV